MKTTFSLAVWIVSFTLLTIPVPAQTSQSPPVAQVQSKRIFPTPLEWAGPREPDSADSDAVLAAAEAFESTGLKGGLDALEAFLVARPASPWAPSIRAHLAEDYTGRGRFSLALAHWDAAWTATRTLRDPRSQKLAARAAAGWAGVLAGLGHKEELATLLHEVQELELPLGVHGTAVLAARARLESMRAKPGSANGCGLVALNALAGRLHLDALLRRQMLQTPAPDNGFSVSQLLALAQSNNVPLEAVRRPIGAQLIVPCLVHWKLDHFAVISERKGGGYRVLDPAFGGELWMDAEGVDEESSGVFLVHQGVAPQSFARLTLLETDAVRGKGYPDIIPDWEDSSTDECDGGDDEDANCDPPSANDGGGGGGPPNPPPPCCGDSGGGDGGGDASGGGDGSDGGNGNPDRVAWGSSGSGGSPSLTPLDSVGQVPAMTLRNGPGMPRWRVSQPYVSLWLHDTPLFYRQSSGKPMQLNLSYKQRGEDRGSGIGGFGPNWECNWLGRLAGKENQDYFTNHLAGGGRHAFHQNGTADYSSGRGVVPVQTIQPLITPALADVPYLQGPGSNPALRSGSGSANIYSFTVDFPTKETNYFLTYKVDRYGRALKFDYETVNGVTRVKRVFDLDGRTNTFSYTNASANLVTAVTDPYGRTARFFYDHLGRLTNITDMAGMASSFQYDTSCRITNLSTPYGQTVFKSFEGLNEQYGSQNRAMLVSEPNGEHQLYAYCGNGPAGVAGDNLWSYRNSYRWNRAQYTAISAQGKTNYLDMPTADYDLAETRHWLHGPNSGTALTLSDTLEAMAGPVDPATGSRLPITYFKYQGQDPAAPFQVGTLKRVTQISISQLPQPMVGILRNSQGRPLVVTNFISTDSLACYTNFFDPSGRFLQRQIGNCGELVRGYGYHSVYTNLLTSVTNAVGEVIRYTHDTNTMKVTSITFPGGLVRTNIYYASGPNQGFLQRQIDLGFRTNSFSYTNGNVLVHTNELGLVTTNTWDSLNRLVSTAFPDGTTVSNIYSKLDLSAAKDRLNHWTRYGYNAVRQLTSETNVNSQVTDYEYCGCGSGPSVVRQWLGARSLVTYFNHDLRGQLTNTVFADGYEVNRAYDLNGMLQTVSDSGERRLELEYTPLGPSFLLERALAGPPGNRITVLHQTFDEYGHVLRSTNRNQVSVTNGYDLIGRLTSRQAFGPSALSGGPIQSGLETFVYNARGLTNYSDPLGKVTRFVRDVAGRVLYQTNANLEVLQFAYNPAGQLASLLDGKNQSTTWHFDEYGRVTNKVDATSTEILRYKYDPGDRLTNRWSIAKGTTSYTYDDIGNLLSIIYPQYTISYGYDGLNRLTNMVDSIGTTAFTWTDGGQLASEDGPWAADTVSYVYSNRLRARMSLAQPNTSPWVQGYEYDDFGRLQTTTSPAGTFGYAYQDFDLISNLSYPSGANSQRTYDDLRRLTDISLYHPNGTTVLDRHAYAYDLGSQRTQQVFTASNFVNYAYDNIGQLKTATGWEADGSTPRLHEKFGYAYDTAWNLNYRTNNQLVQSFGVNNLNELTTAGRSGTLTVAGTVGQASLPLSVNVSGTGLSGGSAEVYRDGSWARAGATLADGQNSYTANGTDGYGRTSQDAVSVSLPSSVSFYYDGNGNLTNDGARVFEYDTENQLTAITVSNGWRSEFAYDGFMRRRVRREFNWAVGAWLSTNEVRYVYDASLALQERGSMNSLAVTYTRGTDFSGTKQGAGGVGGLMARSDSTAHALYHCDAGGNVTFLFNTYNLGLAHYSYDSFGNILEKYGALAHVNLYQFSGKEVHPNSGLLHYPYRYYHPNLQRWVSRDPLKERGGINLFSFSQNNPLKFYDPDGRCPASAPGIPNFFTGLTAQQQLEASKTAAPAAVAVGAAAAVTIFAPELWALPLSTLPNAATLGEAVQFPFFAAGMAGGAAAMAGGAAARGSYVYYGLYSRILGPVSATAGSILYERLSGQNSFGPPPSYGALSLFLWWIDDGPDLVEHYLGCD